MKGGEHMTKLFTEQQLEAHSLALLRWAYGKTGSRSAAEDLAQEIWMQLYQSMQTGTAIQQPERYLWKIARYVWCRHLRSTVYCAAFEPLEDHSLAAEEPDPAHQHAEEAEKAYFVQKMRKKLMELNRYQREIMIRYYIEGQPQKTIAQDLGISVSTVKWHLFDTRQRLKEELMESNEFVYRPRKLVLSISGRVADFDTNNGIQSSLSRQNICLSCYRKGQSTADLSSLLGIPQAYVENDVQWLVEHELLEADGQLYRTAFLIESRQAAQEKHSIYLKCKPLLSDVIVNELLSAEDKIRAIGFHGSDQPMNKLLWLLIYLLGDEIFHADPKAEPPIREDGGKYYMLGFDSDEPDHVMLDLKGWKKNGTMRDGEGFCWMGMESFDFADPVYLFIRGNAGQERMKDVLCRVLKGENDLAAFSEEDRYEVSALVEKGYLRRENNRLVPSFCTFTEKEYQKLKMHVFWPIARKLVHALKLLNEELENMCSRNVPRHLAHLLPFAVQAARYDLAYLTTFFAYQDGQLHIPQSVQEGAMLTLAYIKPE